jgi:hypothetical protein
MEADMAKKRSSKKTTRKAGSKSKKNVRKVTAKKRAAKTKRPAKAKSPAKAPAPRAKKPRARKSIAPAVIMPEQEIEARQEAVLALPFEETSPARPEIETHEAVEALTEEAVSVAVEALSVVLPRDEIPASDDEPKDAEAA